MNDDAKGLKEEFEGFLARKFRTLSTRGRIVFIVATVMALFLAARIGMFGNDVKQFAQRAVPVHIPVIDPVYVKPDVYLTFKVRTDTGWQQGKRFGETYRSEDEFLLSVNSESNTGFWYCIFCIDSKKTGLFKEVSFFPDKERSRKIRFELDDTIGYEAWYVVASKKKFDFEKEVMPGARAKLAEIQRLSAEQKGPVRDDYALNLDKKFASDYIWFRHVGAKKKKLT